MDYLLITYVVYIIVMTVVVGWAGWHLHHAGKPFVRAVFSGDDDKADITNNLLLTGYYLLNLGYSFLLLNRLPEIRNAAQVFEALSWQTGLLILALAVMHYGNIFLFALWKKYRKGTFTSKIQ